jgi:hypothetical protein
VVIDDLFLIYKFGSYIQNYDVRFIMRKMAQFKPNVIWLTSKFSLKCSAFEDHYTFDMNINKFQNLKRKGLQIIEFR